VYLQSIILLSQVAVEVEQHMLAVVVVQVVISQVQDLEYQQHKLGQL
jgi:hypothetical protein